MKRSIPAAIVALLATTAHADTIAVGWWDSHADGGIHQIYTQPSFDLFTLSGQSFGPTFTGVMSGWAPGGYYESAINNIFSSGEGTARIYMTFSGVTVAGNNPLLLPTIFQRNEDALPGWTAVEQIFICSNGNLFCDNFINPTGTLIGADAFI